MSTHRLNTGSRAFSGSTLVDLLTWRARQEPLDGGYVFLEDGEQNERSLTFQELHSRAAALAASLSDAEAAGNPVLLILPSGLDFIVAFFATLYAGAIPTPVYPPRPNRPLDRFEAIARDSGAAIIVTSPSTWSRLEPILAQRAHLPRYKWITVDSSAPELPHEVPRHELPPPALDPPAIALLQYTSGSTAKPKGVVVTHANILHNSRVIGEAFGMTDASVGIGWLPMTHDMGLIGNVVQPLHAGCRLVFMAPEHFLVKPVRWLRAISKYRGTTSGGPNFAYDYCAHRIKPELRADIDLRSWAVAFNGAEPVRAQTLSKFATEFSPCGFRREAFYPCYGLAESTLLVTGGERLTLPVERQFHPEALRSNRAVVDLDAGRPFIGCGSARAENRVVIADPDALTALPEGEIGEVWVTGPSVAQGYWGKPDETERAFRCFLQDTGEGPFLRTGDLGFLLGGILFVTGRLKDLIIIGGANHFPADIEATVEKCDPAIRANSVAAISVVVSDAERCVIVAEVQRHDTDPAAVTRAIRAAVAREHDVATHDVCLVREATIPKTSSGKIQRHLCRHRYLEGTLTLVTDEQARRYRPTPETNE